jgi:tartrate dehydratase beta subunit/fumarate hydratase class I family protein
LIAAILAMGEAFDRTCELLRIMGDTLTVREIIAKRIIEAAKNGERDPARLYEQALIVFGIVVSVGNPPVPAYAAVTHPA